ncbi:MAG: hypothetical protein IJI01_00690 [Butyrivibrio sp.]|uniref:alginate O-acetyltransferase AlgX-related protein n=1 Tax=Butyrivibrio sp. TaxID=28121 RepID=UPI0025C3585E|nr:hypothetical protein [Butyrivibrio sp.]MBQ6587175.1 hypothetical protein [Butyrivibrio sp.]
MLCGIRKGFFGTVINRKHSNYLYIVVLGLAIFGLGVPSFGKLLNYYINDVVSYNEWTPELGNEFETNIASTFYKKMWFVNVNGAIRNVLNQPEMNGVIKLNNGYLLSPMDKCSDEKINECVDNTATFNEYLQEKGIQLVYAATPYTCSKYDDELPKGIEDYGNSNVDRLVSGMREAGIDTIDFREEMHDDDTDQYDMMYRTDHHWTTEAGFYAYGILEDYIQDKTGCDVDRRISDISNYTVTRYNKWHLGSNGQRTGIYYAGIDDFDLILPDFNTRLQDANGNVGTMQEMMINTGPLKVKDYTSRYTYDFVLGKTLGQYVNLEASNNVKLLVITDSFGKAVSQYLALGFKEIYCVDNDEVSGVTPEFIESYDPDIVIMLYYPGKIKDDSVAYSFNGFDN